MQFDQLKRREFIAGLGGAAAWPLITHAQQSTIPIVGFLHSGVAEAYAGLVAAFRAGLSEIGYVEGRDIAIEYRWAQGHYDRLAGLAADLVHNPVNVIFGGGPPAAVAAKTATSTIPVIFVTGDDPVKVGLVGSLNRPGGNVTGVYLFLTGLETKKLGLLLELVPQALVIAALINPENATAPAAQASDLQAAARTLRRPIQIFNASSEHEIDMAMAAIAQLRAGALLVGADVFFGSRRNQIVTLAARYAIPTIYELRDFAVAGGLMSYGTSLVEGYRQAGLYVGRVLKGENPADLPVQQATRFEFVINLKTARALSLTIPAGVLAIADEVIQ